MKLGAKKFTPQSIRSWKDGQGECAVSFGLDFDNSGKMAGEGAENMPFGVKKI